MSYFLAALSGLFFMMGIAQAIKGDLLFAGLDGALAAAYLCGAVERMRKS